MQSEWTLWERFLAVVIWMGAIGIPAVISVATILLVLRWIVR